MMLLAAAAPPPPAQPLPAIDAVFYGLVQGVAEFLPVSSSTHLALLSRFLEASGRKPIDEAYVMLFHLPTLAAVLWVLRRELAALLGSRRGLIWPILLATAVTAALGFPLNHRFESGQDSLSFLGTTLACTGLILLLAERLKPPAVEGPWTWDRGLAVGLGQALAGIPGLSRLGMSSAAGILTGRSHVHAVVFSFLCAIPVTLGKTCLECWKCKKAGEPAFWTHRVLEGAFPLGALIAFAAGVVTFRWLMGFLKRRTLLPFGLYCAILGGVTLTWSLSAVKMPPSAPAAPVGTQGDEPKARIPGLAPDSRPAPAPDEPDLLQRKGPRQPPLSPP